MDPYISNPSYIVDFTDFSTPDLYQGESGFLEITIVNRYENDITEVKVGLEIYRNSVIDESKDISEIKYPPVFFLEGRESIGDGTTEISFQIAELAGKNSTIKASNSETIEFKVITSEDTSSGIYFVRTMIVFTYTHNNGSSVRYYMKSIGHFTTEQWANARDSDHIDTGGINLTKLKVSGITPDTAFTVSVPDPFRFRDIPVIGRFGIATTCAICFSMVFIITTVFIIIIIILIWRRSKRKSLETEITQSQRYKRAR